MSHFNKQIDAAIKKAAPFAQPIMEHLRELVHKACPEVEEKIKWGHISFEYKGMFCGIGAFKHHCTFGFWKHNLLKDKHKILEDRNTAMGSIGKITDIKELPADKLIIAAIKDAMKLNDEGVKMPIAKRKTEPKELIVPDYFIKLLNKNKAAKMYFDEFCYSAKKEYVEWITEAKTDTTRESRLSTSIEWLSEGKHRLWKYQKK